jgi:hypothetical protein
MGHYESEHDACNDDPSDIALLSTPRMNIYQNRQRLKINYPTIAPCKLKVTPFKIIQISLRLRSKNGRRQQKGELLWSQ